MIQSVVRISFQNMNTCKEKRKRGEPNKREETEEMKKRKEMEERKLQEENDFYETLKGTLKMDASFLNNFLCAIEMAYKGIRLRR